MPPRTCFGALVRLTIRRRKGFTVLLVPDDETRAIVAVATPLSATESSHRQQITDLLLQTPTCAIALFLYVDLKTNSPTIH